MNSLFQGLLNAPAGVFRRKGITAPRRVDCNITQGVVRIFDRKMSYFVTVRNGCWVTRCRNSIVLMTRKCRGARQDLTELALRSTTPTAESRVTVREFPERYQVIETVERLLPAELTMRCRQSHPRTILIVSANDANLRDCHDAIFETHGNRNHSVKDGWRPTLTVRGRNKAYSR